jgi:hypothetical protein
MATLTQGIPRRRRPQIFRDQGYAVIEAALAEQEDKLVLWLKHNMHDLARAIRKIGGHYVRSVHRAVSRSASLDGPLIGVVRTDDGLERGWSPAHNPYFAPACRRHPVPGRDAARIVISSASARQITAGSRRRDGMMVILQ